MTKKIFRIGHESVRPGTQKSIYLPITKLYTHTDLSMPVNVIHSSHNGPVVFVSAALHGDEINGVEIIRRLLKVISPSKIKGTIVAVPVVNIHGFISRSRYLPDRRDLNRAFPGTDSGNMASRVAHIFLKEIVDQCTHGIDLHTAAIHRTNLPQIRVCLKDKKAKKMAESFNAPVILDSGLIEGSLRNEVYKKKIPIIVYEAGEALRYNEIGIRAGVNGILSVMDHLGMFFKKPKIKETQSFVAKSSKWERASESGVFREKKKLGNLVKKGDILGYIADPFGKNEVKVISSTQGMIIGKTQIPLVDKGEALFHIASFKKEKSVKEEVLDYQSELQERPIYLNTGI